MADDDKGLIQRVVEVWPLLAGAVTVAGFLYHLEGSAGQNTRDLVTEQLARTTAIAEVKADVEARDRRRDEHDKAQDDHMQRVDEGRAVGLQRIATLEQGQKMTQDLLAGISSKLDRMLMENLGPKR